jgi:hypothetical protein
MSKNSISEHAHELLQPELRSGELGGEKAVALPLRLLHLLLDLVLLQDVLPPLLLLLLLLEALLLLLLFQFSAFRRFLLTL